MKQHIIETFPEIMDITDDHLRNKVIQMWADTLKLSDFERLDGIPFTLLIPDADEDFVQHTRRVTAMARAVAEQRDDVNMDLIIAGGLLHDVGKLLEYTPQEGGVRKSRFGRLIRHPVSGVWLAMKNELPVEIAHIIGAHSKEGELVERIPEAIIVNHCDFIDFDIAKYRHRKKGEK